ncbi:hypothetical protein BDW69DRAFT_141759 [Aspergillus filifer]
MSKSTAVLESPPGPLSHGGNSHSINNPDLAIGGLKKRSADQGEFAEKNVVINNREESIEEGLKPSYDHTHRKLKPRHVQLIGIGGTIGTALYVQIGQTLAKGGPGSLFIAFSIWCCVILCITVCMTTSVFPCPSNNIRTQRASTDLSNASLPYCSLINRTHLRQYPLIVDY